MLNWLFSSDLKHQYAIKNMSNIESITTSALSIALDVASARHQAIATNIANVNAEVYTPQTVSFDSQMVQARSTLREQGSLSAFSLSDMTFRMDPVLQPDGQPARVELDMEMGDMAKNAVQYQALLKGLTRHFSIMALAASDGKK